MKTVQVYLNSIQKVNSFSHELEQFDNDFDLVSGRYIVDAKSVMGIFSLDLNEPTTLNIHATDSEMGPILEAIKPYIVSEDPNLSKIQAKKYLSKAK